MKANKRLGQHFLRDVGVLQEIAAVADVARSAGVLEIGPGEGALTAFLVGDGPVVALEKDHRAVSLLNERFGDRIRVVEGDALTEDLGALLPPARAGRRPVVVGNLPYNAASAIYQRLLALGSQVSRLVLMFQREVAERIVADAGDRRYGLPSILTQLVARAHLICEVPPEAFAPRPKVYSAVLLIEPLDEARLSATELDVFLAFVRPLFQSRRKILSNAAGIDLAALEQVGITASARVEQLSLEQLLTLWRAQQTRTHGT